MIDEAVRQKYLCLVRTAGLDEAITALHQETNAAEIAVFDGGYHRDRFERAQRLRELARELYSLRLNIERD